MDLLRNRQFLKLFGTRMVGSLGDGILQAALAAFVVFSPERQATPLAIATSFGVLLLPYSFIGPFAGVFLDRWRRRQVLVYANWLRGCHDGRHDPDRVDGASRDRPGPGRAGHLGAGTIRAVGTVGVTAPCGART